ncbi:MAG TPA: LCP family protein [Candidatus Limnocylindrales bacterium]|nr:LCP family protein [Candidatus Limnocylindrales bacterium]
MSAPSPALAAVLSFLFPGLGQVYAGAPRRGLLWAIPMALFVLAVIWLLLGGMNAVIGLVLNPQTRNALLVLNIAFFFYHLAAMFDAYAVARQERLVVGGGHARAAPAVLAGLVVLTLLFHGVPQAVGMWGSAAIEDLFKGNPGALPGSTPRPIDPEPSPGGSPSPGMTPGQTPAGSPSPGQSPSPRPSPTPAGSPAAGVRPCPQIDPNWAMGADGRVNLLLIGSDSRSDEGDLGGASLRTDTMILLTVDVATCKAAMFGFPRNMVNAPLEAEAAGAYPGGRFDDLLNALWRRAAEQPGTFPGSEGIGPECARQYDCQRGWRAIAGAIQEMTGAHIDGIIAVNLRGFIALVDTVGGVWLDIPQRVQDPRYRKSDGTVIELDIPRGCNFFDGEMALAYARSRRQDSDYQRMRRQQYVIAQVRRQLDPLAMLPRAPELLAAARENLFTTLDDSDLGPLAQLASGVDSERMHQVRFVRQRFNTDADIRQMRNRVRDIFQEAQPTPTPTPRNRPAQCPAPGQTPRP